MGKIKNNQKVSFILLAISLALILFSIFLWLSRPIEIKVLDISFAVGDSLGVGFSGKNELDFGRLFPGSVATRSVIFESDYDFPTRIEIFASRDFVEYLHIEKEYFAEEREKISIPITIKAPEDLDFRNYSGKIEFRIFNQGQDLSKLICQELLFA